MKPEGLEQLRSTKSWENDGQQYEPGSIEPATDDDTNDGGFSPPAMSHTFPLDPDRPQVVPNFAWRSSVGRQDIDRLHPDKSEPAPTSVSNDSRWIVRDNGEKLRLNNEREAAEAGEEQQATHSRTSADTDMGYVAGTSDDPRPAAENSDDVVRLTGQWEHTTGGLPLERGPSTLTEIFTANPPSAEVSFNSDTSTVLPSQPVPVTNEWPEGDSVRTPQCSSMEDAIRAKLVTPDRGSISQEEFFPCKELDRIVTKENIIKELRVLSVGLTEDQIDRMAGQIRDEHEIWLPGRKDPDRTSRRRIFAILVSINALSDIKHFINGKIFDRHLPFSRGTGTTSKYHLFWEDHAKQRHPVPLPPRGHHFIESFTRWQRKFDLVYFKMFRDGVPRDKVLHYRLHRDVVLPFTHSQRLSVKGATADVFSVKIHPDHHDHPDHDTSFAVKRLREHHDDDAKLESREAKEWMRMVSVRHPFLSSLCLTFLYRGQFHLVSPLADGNLLDFWKKPDPPPRTQNFAVWFLKQCWGIADGLDAIYAPDGDQRHGRHGDFKPENILWFRKGLKFDGKDPFPLVETWGSFQINDFGLSESHSSGTDMVDAESLGRTPTYRAPEFDVGKRVKAKCDIWALGCTLLEWVSWYMGGWDEVYAFSGRRAKDDIDGPPGFTEDKFFSSSPEKCNGHPVAIHKVAVLEQFGKLLSSERCFDFLGEFLHYIQHYILRLSADERASCSDIRDKFAELLRKAQKDEAYCTQQNNKWSPRTDSGLSILCSRRNSEPHRPGIDAQLCGSHVHSFAGQGPHGPISEPLASKEKSVPPKVDFSSKVAMAGADGADQTMENDSIPHSAAKVFWSTSVKPANALAGKSKASLELSRLQLTPILPFDVSKPPQEVTSADLSLDVKLGPCVDHHSAEAVSLWPPPETVESPAPKSRKEPSPTADSSVDASTSNSPVKAQRLSEAGASRQLRALYARVRWLLEFLVRFFMRVNVRGVIRRQWLSLSGKVVYRALFGI